jgi:FeS assembly SUF system protein
MMIFKDEAGLGTAIIEKLKMVYDPEIPVDIYELGLVYEVTAYPDGSIKVLMSLTAPNCPAADLIIRDTEARLKEIEGVKDVVIEITFDPPWDQDMMSEEAKLELGFL